MDTIDGTDYYSTSVLEYDIYGNVVQTIQNSNKIGEEETFNISKYTYDVNDRLIQTEDVINNNNSRFSQYCYDSGGRLVKTFTGLTDPLTIYSNGNYSTNNDKVYSTTSYIYDEYGNLIKYTDPLGKSEEYDYSFSNVLKSKIQKNGKTTIYNNDSLGRCNSINTNGEKISYTYNVQGQIESMTDELGTTYYEYDLLNRLTKETRDDKDNKRDYKAEYQYVNSGISDYKLYTRNIDTAEFQNSVHETYEYNNLDQITKFTHADITTPEEILNVSYSYGVAGELLNKSVTGAAFDQSIDYTYNKAGFKTKIENINTSSDASKQDAVTFVQDCSYSLDGNLIEKSTMQNVTNSVGVSSYENSETAYTYDTLNRLTQETTTESKNGGTEKTWGNNYTYDESDNRLSKSYFSGTYSLTTNYNYDRANRLTYSKTSESNKYTYSYDDAGNLIKETHTYHDNPEKVLAEYTYDSFNRLSTASDSSSKGTYLYDGNGRRIQKEVLTIDSNENWIETLQEFWINGRIGFENYRLDNFDINSSFSYVFDNDLIATTTNNPEKNLAIVDVHGDTVNLLFSEYTYDTRYKYDAFGIQQETKKANEVFNPYQYNGKYLDAESNLYYLNARYYSPEIGRFTQEDTYHGNTNNASTLNLYNYCGSNPIAYEDPTGHFWETAFDVASLAWSAYDFAKKPNLVNGLFLAWDVVALVAPFVPGSYVAKGIKLVSKGAKYLTKTLKTSNKVAKTAKYLDKAYDTSKTIKRIKNSRKTLETAAEVNKRKRQLAKVATENKVKELTKGLEKLSSSKGRIFTQEAAEQSNKSLFTNIKHIDSTREYTKSSLKMGQDMHKMYKADIANQTTKIKEFVLPSKKRIDFIDFDSGTISELKPYNPRAIKSGYRQLEMYLREVQTEFPNIDWQTQLDVY